MPNRSLYGRARRDSFLQRWFAKSELHAGTSPSQLGILGISQNPTPGILSNFSLRLARKFQAFLWRRMGIFFFPRPFWEFSPVADDRSDSHQETARK
jgi:hypothetical protein